MIDFVTISIFIIWIITIIPINFFFDSASKIKFFVNKSDLICIYAFSIITSIFVYTPYFIVGYILSTDKFTLINPLGYINSFAIPLSYFLLLVYSYINKSKRLLGKKHIFAYYMSIFFISMIGLPIGLFQFYGIIISIIMFLPLTFWFDYWERDIKKKINY